MRSFRRILSIPRLYMLIGLMYLFEPLVISWMKVVAPIWVVLIGLPFVWIMGPFLGLGLPTPGFYTFDIVFGLITILYILYFVRVARSQSATRQKTLVLLPLLILLVVWASMIPLGYSFSGEKRFNSYAIGGWSRIMLAGGPAILKAEAVELLNSTDEYQYGIVPASKAPPSLQKLGRLVIEEKDKGLVLVTDGIIMLIGDEFGYIIHDSRLPWVVPERLMYSRNVRIWQVGEDVYFYVE